MGFPEVIRQTRKAKGLSQTTVATELGVSQNAVSDWETGRFVPTVPLLAALATLLDLDHGLLLRLAAGDAPTVEATSVTVSLNSEQLLAGAARPSTADSPGGEGWTGTAGSTTTSPGSADSSCVASSTVAAPAAPVVPLLRR